LSFHWTLYSDIEIPRKDRIRYADYIYNLSTFGVFGLSDGEIDTPATPGIGNLPVYLGLMAGVADQQATASLACYLERTHRSLCETGGAECAAQRASLESCPHNLEPLILMNYALAGLSLFLCGLIAFQLFGNNYYLYLTPLFAYLSFTLTDYAQRIMVTNMVVPLFLLLQFSVLRWLDKPRILSAVIIGMVLALLALTRPEYLYLFLFVALCCCYMAVKKPDCRSSLIPLLLAFVVVISPWAWRNNEISGKWQLTESQYGSIVLAHRVAYNDMSTPEWLVAFVYWFPDVGDSIAKRVFPESTTRRQVSEAEGSYYEIAQRLDRQSREHDRPTLWLLRQIMAHPVKHTMTTLAFVWRGLLIGKWWALAGLLGYLLLLRRELRHKRYGLLWISTLPIAMMALRAGVSLNVARYNMPLIAVYAMGWVYLVLPARLNNQTNNDG
jgi:hypothetical protein